MKGPGKMLREVFEHLFMKPATGAYPYRREDMPARFRGQIEFKPERCIGCRACVRDCPAGAIDIRKVGERKFEADFKLDHCIYCSQCVDSCRHGALAGTTRYRLAELDRSKLKVTFKVKPEDEPGKQS